MAQSLLRQPLEARKARLAALVGGGTSRIRYSEHVVGQGPAFFEHATRLGVEGIVSKRRDAAYQPGRRSGWLKIKCLRTQRFVIGGYTDQEGMAGGLGALLVGYYAGGRLTFAGRVGSGLAGRSGADLLQRLTPMARRTSPFDSAAGRTARQIGTLRRTVARVPGGVRRMDRRRADPSSGLPGAGAEGRARPRLARRLTGPAAEVRAPARACRIGAAGYAR